MESTRRVNKITENTYISVGVLIFIIGGASWITTVAARVEDVRDEQHAIEKRLDQTDRKLEAIEAIRTDVAVIREKVETLEKRRR